MLKILIIGYNGANNTGAEALLLQDIRDLFQTLNQPFQITIPSLNPANLKRYLTPTEHIRIINLSPFFLAQIARLVREHDLILLVEGSTYMESWSSVLLWFFLWSTQCAFYYHKPLLAYAVDAGPIRSPLNRYLIRKIASKSSLIIFRSHQASHILREYGITAPLVVSADNALEFGCLASEAETRPAIKERPWGLAPVDVTIWPVKIRLWGGKKQCYRWPYYFSQSTQRIHQRNQLLTMYAGLCDQLIQKEDRPLLIFAMEALDEPFCREIYERSTLREKIQIISAREYDAFAITSRLRALHFLLTSRYHAAILSLGGSVPQIAIGHDQRLHQLYRELNLAHRFFTISQFPDSYDKLVAAITDVLSHHLQEEKHIQNAYSEFVARSRENRQILRSFLNAHGWKTRP